MATDKKRLQEFRGSGFEMVKGQPDIHNWQVISSDGHRLGKVSELIIDTVAQRVRYLVVALTDNKELQLEKRNVLVPIGFAQLHPADDSVILASVTPYQLRALPRYDRSHLGPKSEIDISQVFGREHTALGSNIAGEDLDQNFYNHEHFDDRRLNRPTASRDTAPLRREAEELPASHLTGDDPEAIRRRHEQNLRDEEEARRKGLL
ncbi:PRC-barrel domain-containing protein [Flaviaesturariibacter terrae]